MNPALVFKVISLLYIGMKSPLVTKFLDNLTAGTTTKVDDWLWNGAKELLGTYEPSKKKVDELLEKIQGKYDEDKQAAKVPAALDFGTA